MTKQLMPYRFRPHLQKKWMKRGEGETLRAALAMGVPMREVIEAARRSLYYGIELEIPGPSQESILSLLGELDPSESDLWYCKRDGSIPFTGVEVVSQPATERYHLHAFGWQRFWQGLQELLHRSPPIGDDLWSSCGMHVHVGRGELSELAQHRVLGLAAGLREVLPVLGGRDYNNYCNPITEDFHVHRAYDSQGHLGRDVVAGDLVDRPIINPGSSWDGHVIPMLAVRFNNRYLALNMVNRATIEWRFMAAPRNEVQFWERLETVQALTGFASLVSEVSQLQEDGTYPQDLRCTPENFFSWIRGQRVRFPHLFALAKQKGLLPQELAARDDGQLWLPFVDEFNLTSEEIRAVPRRPVPRARVPRRRVG